MVLVVRHIWTIRIFREMRERIVISLWFGIVGSLCRNYAELCVFGGRVYTRIDYLLVPRSRSAPIDLRIVQEMIPKNESVHQLDVQVSAEPSFVDKPSPPSWNGSMALDAPGLWCVFDRFEIECVRFFDRSVAFEGHSFCARLRKRLLSCRAPKWRFTTLCVVT